MSLRSDYTDEWYRKLYHACLTSYHGSRPFFNSHKLEVNRLEGEFLNTANPPSPNKSKNIIEPRLVIDVSRSLLIFNSLITFFRPNRGIDQFITIYR